MQTRLILIAMSLLLAVGSAMAQQPQEDNRRGEGGRFGPPDGSGGRGGFGGPGDRGGPGGRGGFGGRIVMGGFEMPNLLMMALDANKDGALSTEEMANATASLKKLDKDEDGILSQEELRVTREQAFVYEFMRFDRNNDQKVDGTELPVQMATMLDRGDTNGDKALDKAELEAMAQNFQGRERGGDRQRGGRDQGQRSPRRPVPVQ